MKIFFSNALSASLSILAFTTVFTSCSTNDGPVEMIDPVHPVSEKIFHIALGIGSTNESSTYAQGQQILNLMDPAQTITYSNYGFEVPSTRTARVYASDKGDLLYNLNYGGGTIQKYETTGAQDYRLLKELNVAAAVGTNNPRWTKINDKLALLHNVAGIVHHQDAQGNYTKTTSRASLVAIDLESFSIAKSLSFEIPYDEEEAAQGYHITRIDAPVVQAGKAYYGVWRRKYNKDTATTANEYANIETLVVDYPSFENPKIIKTTAFGVKGQTYGYRIPVAHASENGDIYQLVCVGATTDATRIMRIKNGQYDETFNFDLNAILGESVYANGWFYVGNGIGYIPYLKSSKGNNATPNWSVARIDLNARTAVEMNVPQGLWLQQYQFGVLKNDKFYMALAPLGGNGHIYEFNTKDTSPNGFVRGAQLQTGADAFYLGIF